MRRPRPLRVTKHDDACDIPFPIDAEPSPLADDALAPATDEASDDAESSDFPGDWPPEESGVHLAENVIPFRSQDDARNEARAIPSGPKGILTEVVFCDGSEGKLYLVELFPGL